MARAPARNQITDERPHTEGDADGLIRMLVHGFVGGLGAVDRLLLSSPKDVLAAVQCGSETLAGLAEFFSGHSLVNSVWGSGYFSPRSHLFEPITKSETNARLVTQRFPDFKLRGTNAADHRLLQYCFPVRSALIGCENRSDRAYYSGNGPLQFLAVDHPVHGSLHAVVCDTNNTRKLFGLDKTDETLRLFVEHEAKLLPPVGPIYQRIMSR